MYASPRQQNRALLTAVAINIGFILAVCIIIAGISRSWESIVVLLLLTGLYVAVVAAVLLRSHQLSRRHRQWLELSDSTDRQ